MQGIDYGKASLPGLGRGKCHKSADSHFYGAKGQETGLRHHDFKVDLCSSPSTQLRGGNVTFAPHRGRLHGLEATKDA